MKLNDNLRNPLQPARPRVGDIITYITLLGRPRRARVVAVFDNVKNGLPGFDAITCGDEAHSVWGYDDQIAEIERVEGQSC